MSREPPDPVPVDLNPLAGDPLDRDARALFAAGAHDQAPARLRAALLARAHGADVPARGALTDLRADSALTDLRAHGALSEQGAHGARGSALPAPRARARGRSWIAPALAAAAGVIAAFSVWSVRRASPDERLLISAEHVPVAAPATLDPRPVPEPSLPEAPRAAPNAPRELEARAAHPRSSPPVRTAKPAAASLPAVSPDSAPGDAVPGSATPTAPPATARPAPGSAVDVPSAASLAAPAQPLAADVKRELELLQSVQKALRAGQGQRALELLDSPGSQLEQGDFAAEARLMRIEALAGSGRRSEATSLAREFLKLFPHSPLADRARRFGAAAP